MIALKVLVYMIFWLSSQYLFKGLGKFPCNPYHIELHKNIMSVIDPPRRVSLAIINELKETLADLEKEALYHG